MGSRELFKGVSKRLDEVIVPPYANLQGSFRRVWHKMDIGLLSEWYVRDYYLVVEQGYFAVSVDHVFFMQAEDILGGGAGSG